MAMQTAPPEKLLTVAELAKRLDVGQAKARAMVLSGDLPCLRVGNSVRFEWDEVVIALRVARTEEVA
tara:strand:- start:7209 stop:7409 length:201 start_codon:yes stop_codon:yes gene_type:complete